MVRVRGLERPRRCFVAGDRALRIAGGGLGHPLHPLRRVEPAPALRDGGRAGPWFLRSSGPAHRQAGRFVILDVEAHGHPPGRWRHAESTPSRAATGGFASPDSDYDVRFIYIHRPDWYLSIADRRDVIERPIVDEYDLSGWELRKTLRLFRKSNPPLIEWLGSPIVYRERTAMAKRLRELSARHHSPRSCAYHYLNMARRNHAAYLQGDRIRLKKYLYVLRPLLAVRWIESGRGIVPMEFERLVEAMVEDPALRRAIDALLARKRSGSELGQGPRIAVIGEFIETEIAGHESALTVGVEAPPALEALDLLFRTMLEEAWMDRHSGGRAGSG